MKTPILAVVAVVVVALPGNAAMLPCSLPSGAIAHTEAELWAVLSYAQRHLNWSLNNLTHVKAALAEAREQDASLSSQVLPLPALLNSSVRPWYNLKKSVCECLGELASANGCGLKDDESRMRRIWKPRGVRHGIDVNRLTKGR